MFGLIVALLENGLALGWIEQHENNRVFLSL